MYPINLVSRSMNEPSEFHFRATKGILCCLQGTKKNGLRYVKEANNDLVSYTDSDWVGSIDDRNSILGYVFNMGSKTIDW